MVLLRYYVGDHWLSDDGYLYCSEIMIRHYADMSLADYRLGHVYFCKPSRDVVYRFRSHMPC